MAQLGLTMDLRACVGCGACVQACREWNYRDDNYSKNSVKDLPSFTQIQVYEVGDYSDSETLHFPKTCMHCENPPCVPVCPTGASYKREMDGIVLVDESKCIGCSYCAWACPYGVRLLDEHEKVIKKCTLCVDRIYDSTLPDDLRKPACVVACPTEARLFGDVHDFQDIVSRSIVERQGYQLMPELGCNPSGYYLPKK